MTEPTELTPEDLDRLERWFPGFNTMPDHVVPNLESDNYYISAEKFFQEAKAAFPALVAGYRRMLALEVVVDGWAKAVASRPPRGRFDEAVVETLERCISDARAALEKPDAN